MAHRRFFDLPDILGSRCVMVFNESRVLRARFRARRQTGAELEGLLLPDTSEPNLTKGDLLKGVLSKRDSKASSKFRAWMRGRVEPGEIIYVEGFGALHVLAKEERAVVFEGCREDFAQFLQTHGEIPIPPYILHERKRRGRNDLQDHDEACYQSRLAASQGPRTTSFSSAAPTASLHFDNELLQSLEAAGIDSMRIGLDIGAPTFAPLDEGDLSNLAIAGEWIDVREEAWQRIMHAKANGKKIVAVGTTALRALESAARWGAGHYETKLTVKPPFEFKIVDSLITNFHWSRSSLLVLAATFMSHGASQATQWRTVYEEALKRDYLFYSFGDAMLIE